MIMISTPHGTNAPSAIERSYRDGASSDNPWISISGGSGNATWYDEAQWPPSYCPEPLPGLTNRRGRKHYDHSHFSSLPRRRLR